MCGIAGILSTTTDLSSKDTQIKLRAMREALRHRGPDDSGDYFSPSGSAALCHTRLSIIDLSSSGHQPMVSECRNFVITFNGEIYNYQTLRAELEQLGTTFQSQSDTEVVLELYRQYGSECVQKLRGMFAFVIWDESKKSAFAARDPFGIKPLYYTLDQNGDFAFSSELRSLLRAKMHSNELSSEGVRSFFRSGSVSEPHTILNDVRMLKAGSSLSWANGQTEISTYWRLPFSKVIENPVKNSEQAAKHTRMALEDTIKAHLVSDVPVGIFLSGGIDSSVLVALASSISDTPINTYSIAFESPKWNEADIAKKVSDHFGTNHTEFLITAEIALPMFKTFLSSVDQPTTDGFNTYCVSQLAQKHGEKVVLSGLGGDELFAGYKSFELVPKMAKLSSSLGWFSGFFAWLNKKTFKLLPSRLQRILEFLASPGEITPAYRSLRGIFSDHESQALCHQLDLPSQAKQASELEGFVSEAFASESSNTNPREQVSELELTGYMRNQLLRDSDVMSMSCGLELRVPFVDRPLVEAISQIPPDLRLRQGKQLLIDAVPELPAWLLNRPKQGFQFPFDEWFSREWKNIDLPYTPPSWIALQPWYRKWALVVLAEWQHKHLGKAQ